MNRMNPGRFSLLKSVRYEDKQPNLSIQQALGGLEE